MTGETKTGFDAWVKCGEDVFGQAMEAGTRFQREMVEKCQETLTEAMRTGFEQTQRSVKEVVPTVRKSFGETTRAFEAQGKAGLEAGRRVMATVEGLFDEDLANKTMDAWQTSFDAMCSGFEAMSRTQQDWFERWTGAAKQCCSTKRTTETAGTKKQ